MVVEFVAAAAAEGKIIDNVAESATAFPVIGTITDVLHVEVL